MTSFSAASGLPDPMPAPLPTHVPDTLPDLTARFGAEPLAIARTLLAAGHDAVLVGGAVRDTLLGHDASDVDLATSAPPAVVQTLFPRTFVQGRGLEHGTIGVLGPSGTKYEVTTFRRDVATDGRHATVAFDASLAEDLERRDFTLNAIAVRPHVTADHGALIDPFGGRADLAAGLLRAVGTPGARFAEDALRVLRAYRFAGRYGLTIESATRGALRQAVGRVDQVSRERIREELLKLMAQVTEPGALASSLRTMADDGLLYYILPELAMCDGVEQGPRHAFDVMTHCFAAADAAGATDPRLRFAVLLHDIGKPMTRSEDPDGRVRFFNHDVVGAHLAGDVCQRLKFSAADAAWIAGAVRWHMEFSQVNRGISDTHLLKIAKRLTGGVTLHDLLTIRKADKQGAGVASVVVDADAERQLRQQIARLATAAVTVGQLAIGGRDVMRTLGLTPGKEVRRRLDGLLDRVIEDPALNTPERLLAILREGAREDAATADAVEGSPAVDAPPPTRPTRA